MRSRSFAIAITFAAFLSGCVGGSASTEVAEPVSLSPAVWAPKRIYAPLDGLTRSGAESILRAEAVKDCGGDFESRSFVVARPEAAEMLAIEYVCSGAAPEQGVNATVAPATLLQ